MALSSHMKKAIIHNQNSSGRAPNFQGGTKILSGFRFFGVAGEWSAGPFWLRFAFQVLEKGVETILIITIL